MAEAQEPMPVDSAAAEAAKAEANIAFKEHHFPQAVVGYTRAIDLDPSNAVYYSNRAFAHIKLENFGSAIADATKSLELDPTYVKAYYRRGDAQFALGHFKDSLSDFKKASAPTRQHAHGHLRPDNMARAAGKLSQRGD
eukprot:jgi/Tetstr1/421543/TSEL_012490.t1